MDIGSRHEATAYVLDDDTTFQDSVAAIASTIDLRCQPISATAIHEGLSRLTRPGCLILDHNLGGGTNGLDVMRLLREAQSLITTIVCSGYADTELAVAYMRAGALTVVEKPAEPRVLSDWMNEAIRVDRDRLLRESRVLQLMNRHEALTPRQKEILHHLLNGKSNKWIAIRLDVSRRTVEMDRARILSEFDTSNIVELASLATECIVSARHLGLALDLNEELWRDIMPKGPSE